MRLKRFEEVELGLDRFLELFLELLQDFYHLGEDVLRDEGFGGGDLLGDHLQVAAGRGKSFFSV